jgi:hypothetical protein
VPPTIRGAGLLLAVAGAAIVALTFLGGFVLGNTRLGAGLPLPFPFGALDMAANPRASSCPSRMTCSRLMVAGPESASWQSSQIGLSSDARK